MGWFRNTKRFLANFRELVVMSMPATAYGNQMRYKYWSKRVKRMGTDVRIDPHVLLQNPQFITLDDGCWVDRGVMIFAGPDGSPRPRSMLKNPDFKLERGEVYIGKRTHLAPYTHILGQGGVTIGADCGIAENTHFLSITAHGWSHKEPWDRSFIATPRGPPEKQYLIEGPIVIEDNVAVAINAVVMAGVTVRRDSGILIGAVVVQGKEPLPENALIGQVPGSPYSKPIRERFVPKDKAKESRAPKEGAESRAPKEGAEGQAPRAPSAAGGPPEAATPPTAKASTPAAGNSLSGT